MSNSQFKQLFTREATAGGFEPLFQAGDGSGFAAAQWPSAAPGRGAAPPATMDQVLAEARQQAAVLLEQAREEAEALAPQYVQEALQQARAEQVAAFQAAGRDLLEAVRREHEEALQRLERDMALLVADLVGRIVRETFAPSPEAIVPIVREAVQHLADSAHVRVIVAPEHDEALRAAYHELGAVLQEDARLEITISDGAEPFGCVAHGDHGSVDARLSTRLETIERTVREQVLGSEAA